MFSKTLSRRQVVGGVLKFAALAAGAQFAQLGLLISKANAATRSNLNAKLKVLKVKLSGYNRKVFQSEFGRITPRKPIRSPMVRPGQMTTPGHMFPSGGLSSCPVNLSGQGGFNAVDCSALGSCGSNGDNCDEQTWCGTQVCSGNAAGCDTNTDAGCGLNDCNDQDCQLASCRDNECSDQNCTGFRDCDRNRRSLVETLNQFRGDPYVLGLMKHFRVNDTRQLAKQVQRMVQQRRVLLPNQIMRSTMPPQGLGPSRIYR